MNTFHTVTLVLFVGTTTPVASFASGDHTGTHGAGSVAVSAPKMAAADMADGEVRRVDKEAKKITLRHGEIKSLGMPPMTMVFGVKDPAMLGTLKVGDKIRFTAENVNGAMIVTTVTPAK